MIGIVHDKTVRIPLKDSAGKLKVIEKGNQFVKEAKMLGISFGDGDV
jgi:6-phosphofructokinase 1